VASQFSAPLPKGALLKWDQLPTDSAVTELFHPAVAAAAAATEQSDALAAAAEATDDASADAAAANSDNDDEDIGSTAMEVEEVDFSEDVNAYNREQAAAAAAAAAAAQRSSTQQQQPQPQQHRWELHGCRYYKALLRTGSSSSSSAPLVEALIEISPEYPLRPPALLLRAADSSSSSGSGSSTAVVPAAAADSFSASDFAAVEAEVNAHCAELMGSDVRGWDHVVTHQLLRAVACFQSLNKGGAAASASASASAGAGSSEADRLRRGRGRRGKVLYDELTKSFIHR
jgi:hypothetical protein